MESPNRMALDLVDEAIDFADELAVAVHHLEDEAAVLDFGVEAPGGVEAGLLLAEVATGGLATVQTRLEAVADAGLAHVELSTDHPALALSGCQSPGWPVDVDGETVRVGGPAQLFRDVGPRADVAPAGSFDFAVATVEADRLPGEALAEAVAAEAGVPTSGVFVLVAPARSVAGSVAAAARAGERAVRQFAAAGSDPTAVRSLTASAPVAPLAAAEAEARTRSMAAIAEGGRVHLVVDADLDDPGALGRADDEEAVTAPAQLTVDVAGGPTHVVGGVDEARLADVLGL